MRKIIFLVAASIMFAASLPASAQQSLSHTCESVKTRALNKAAKICGDEVGPDKFGWTMTSLAFEDQKAALQDINNAMNDPAYTAVSKVCLAAIKAYFTACDPKPRDIKRKYTEPTSVKRPIPPAGLLETTPGFTPQGPAAGGTPRTPAGVTTIPLH